MDSMSSRCLILDIPPEIFEMVCSYLSIFDVVKLEALDKATNDRVKESNIWRKRAEGINRKFNYGLIDQMLSFIKTTETHNQQNLHKITIGEDFLCPHMREAYILTTFQGCMDI